ncbi:flavin-containing monooxygenase [Pseudomonas sp. NPDC078700]|uniref:flavin-containing monooxygenase n=1 Tax=Pseudomonas sp. NPDC078700 TaxID=3364424 RepID=UPI0037C76AD6
MAHEHHSVVIIGAGLSGIGMACHLSRQCPGKGFSIIERRDNLGGTWDLFRYPGIRSDSDMFSFGYQFRPWNELKVLADGPSICQYISETAEQYGISQHIQFGYEVTAADWSSAEQCWMLTVQANATGQIRTVSCDFLISCTGYYNHRSGYLPDFPGIEQFNGQCIHPQHWPEDLDYRGKNIVVIGSGATAVTLVPAMAEEAGHITMLQRSPSYIFSVPGRDQLSALLRRFLPESWVYKLARKRNIAVQRWMFKAAKRWPNKVRNILLKGVRKQLPDDFDMRHFSPAYKPWDERLCAVPDGDLFRAISHGKASIVTDQIDTFNPQGIRLKSGQQLDADIIITATGLQLQVLGGLTLSLDGKPCLINQQLTYKGVMMEGVPNMGWIFGYTNASWTLKADIAAGYLCRLLNHMDEQQQKTVVARDTEGCAVDESIMGALQSGYVQRANEVLPRQGSKLPWRLLNDYARDSTMLLEEPVADPYLQFAPAKAVRTEGVVETQLS